jgi:protoporphyrinogen oxidase
MSAAPLRIGIVGAGLAGLSAALDLTRAGHKVTVCESAPEPGGLAGTFSYAGTRLEIFYHHIFTTDLEAIALIRELGLEPKLQWRETPMGIYQDGRLLKFATPVDLLRFSPLSFFNRIRFGLVILYLARRKNWKAYETIKAQDWIRRVFGEQAWQKVWGPLLNGKFGEFAPEIGLPWFYSRVHTRAGSRAQGMTKESLGYLEGSFQILHQALVKEVVRLGGQVRCGERVKSLRVRQSRITGWTTSQRSESLDAVLATPAPQAVLPLLPKGLAGDYWDRLRRVEYLGNVCAVLTLKRSLSPIYWMNIPDLNSPFIAVIEHTNFIPPATYGGRRVMYLSSYLPVSHPRYRQSDAALLKEYYAYLKKVIPDFTPADVSGVKVFRSPHAQPVARAGYGETLVPNASPVAGLFLANMAQIYPEDRGMSYSIRLGRQAARVIMAQGGARG